MHPYTRNDLRQVGDRYEIDVAGRCLSGRRPDILVHRANQLAEAQARPAHFLEAWKEAVTLIGESLFTVTAPSVAAATDKNQLAPDFAAVTQRLGTMSGGERRFLIALYQFYNDTDILTYCEEQGITPPSMSDLALLDDEHLSILTRLLHSYAGW